MDIKKILSEQIDETDLLIYQLTKDNKVSLRTIGDRFNLTAAGVQFRANRVKEQLKKQGYEEEKGQENEPPNWAK